MACLTELSRAKRALLQLFSKLPMRDSPQSANSSSNGLVIKKIRNSAKKFELLIFNRRLTGIFAFAVNDDCPKTEQTIEISSNNLPRK